MATRVKRASAKAAARQPSAATGWDAAVWLGAALLVAAGLISYANSLNGPFFLDDQETIVINEQIRQLWPPLVVLFPARELPVAGRPTVNVSLALNYAFGGLNVRGYHVVNLLIHILAGLLLFGVVRRTLGGPLQEKFGGPSLGRATNLGFACALIWLVHPLQTEAVDYLTQRTELMMGLFFLLTLYASIRGRGRGQGVWLAVAVASCVLGTGSKESMATAPIMVAVYDRVFVFGTWKEAWRERRWFYVALAASWIVLAGLMWSGPRSRSAGFSTGVTPWTYLLNQAVMVVHYLKLAVWPSGFVSTYGLPRALRVSDVLPEALLLVLLVVLTVMALVKRPKLGFLGAWFFVTLAPTSSIVPIATEVGAERRMYLPLAALVVLAIVGLSLLWERLRARASRPAEGRVYLPAVLYANGLVVGFGCLMAVAAVLMARTVSRNAEYASSLSLAEETMKRWPTPRAEHWLGLELITAGQRNSGIATLRHALAGDPTVHYSLGVELFHDGAMDEAVVNLREFLAHESMRIEVPTAHEVLGRALAAQGKAAEADEHFREALRMAPAKSEVYGLLADSLLKQQRFEEAARFYQRLLRDRPGDMAVVTNLGIALGGSGRDDEALAAFRRAVELDSRDGAARRNLAYVLILRRAFDEAALHAAQAVALRPGDPVAHDELGLAWAGQRKLDAAEGEFRRSLELDPNDEDVRTHLAALLQAKERQAKEGIVRRP